MKVLVTGATGLVGRALVSQALANGMSVHFLSTRKAQLDSISGAKGFFWNLAQGEIDTACFEGVDAIINLAGASVAQRWTKAAKTDMLKSRLDSLSALHKGLSELKSHQVKQLISASAIGIYKDSKTGYYDETMLKFDSGFLGQVVAQWEAQADAFDTLGVGVAKIRIGLVLSKEGGALPKMMAPVQWHMGAAFGSGNQWQSWIHLEDLVGIFLFVLQNALTGVYNAVSPNPVIQRKFLAELARVMGKKHWLPPVPKIVLRVVLGEMAQQLLSSQRVSSKKIESEGYHFKHPNLNGALTDLLG
jgi:uncharacterized protein (TIGR01777 family)